MADVFAFKLVTGEEILAELMSTPFGVSDSGYVVRRPHVLQFQQIAPGQLGLALVPWTLSNPGIEQIDIPSKSVVVKFSPSDKIAQQYLQQTTGISLDTGGLKL